MSDKKLSARIVKSWSSYAASAFGVITDCGMWSLNKEWYGSFLGLTGICFQTIYDTKCSARSVMTYDWEKENNEFLQRTGVTADLCCAYNGEPHPTALREIKASIDSSVGAVLWGVDTGEFGVIYGYDDNDGVFHVSGIGGNDSQESNPVLYQNLGNTFGNILYCQFPVKYTVRPIEEMIKDSLGYYVSHMLSDDVNHGLNSYNNLIYALEHDCDDFGVRYTTGVYTERKQHASSFFSDEVKSLYKENESIDKAAELSEDISKLYNEIQFEILKQGFDGWNHLNKPVDKNVQKSIIPVIKEIASKEKECVKLIQNLL